MLHAVIMAGGAGTRFWPASRKHRPKQLLDLLGSRTMIQNTVDRLGDLTAHDRVLIVTNEVLVEPIRQQLPELPPAGVIGEPCKRDTAPCIGLTAALVRRADPDGVMVVMPADHVIKTDEQFRDAIRQAAALVEQQPTRIVTLGIRPTFAAESFGYIEPGEPLAEPLGGSAAYTVSRFREKPNAELAKEFLESGQFFWNSGIFIWKAEVIENALREYEPQMAARIAAIADAFDSDDFDEVFAQEFEAIEGKSIDFAVMEHYEDVAVVEAPFAWDDLGSWGSLPRLHGQDDQGNTVIGRALSLDSSDCIVRSESDHLVVMLGVKGCIVVHTPDATLVANRDDEAAIREVVKMLEERGWDEHL